MKKVDFTLVEDREILGFVLNLNIPFEIEQIASNQIKYSFKRVIDGQIEQFSFTAISNNGMVNTAFDLDLLNEIVKWRNNIETSENFKLFLAW